MQNKNNILFNPPSKMACNGNDLIIAIIESNEGYNKKPWPDVERMQLAIKSLNAGTWGLDITTSALIVCERCKEIIPFCNEKSVSVSRICDVISAGHAGKVVEAFSLALKTGLSFDMEVPISAIKGSLAKWLRITGIAVFDSSKNTAQQIHGIVEDISERKNSELLKQDLLAMVSHDLRSPLSVIKLYMQLFGRVADNFGNNLILEMLKKADRQVDKMNRMIQCYLESSAMRSGKIGHFPVSFDIKELLNEVIADLYLLNPGHIIFLKPGPSIQVYADRERIAQVLQNLVSNAIKYSSRIDVITVHYKKVENYLQVAVEDHGIGIKPAEQEKIFDRFYRVSGEIEMAVKGYGIGLYLTKEIIKQHNGDIWLKSEFNKGSKFYFTLPLF